MIHVNCRNFHCFNFILYIYSSRDRMKRVDTHTSTLSYGVSVYIHEIVWFACVLYRYMSIHFGEHGSLERNLHFISFEHGINRGISNGFVAGEIFQPFVNMKYPFMSFEIIKLCRRTQRGLPDVRLCWTRRKDIICNDGICTRQPYMVLNWTSNICKTGKTSLR